MDSREAKEEVKGPSLFKSYRSVVQSKLSTLILDDVVLCRIRPCPLYLRQRSPDGDNCDLSALCLTVR